MQHDRGYLMPVIRERDPDVLYSRADRENSWAAVLLVVLLIAVLAVFAFLLLARDNDRARVMDQLDQLRIPQPVAIPVPQPTPTPHPVAIPVPVPTPSESNNSGSNADRPRQQPRESSAPTEPLNSGDSTAPNLGGDTAGDATTP